MEKWEVYGHGKQNFCWEELDLLPIWEIAMMLMLTHQLSDPEVHIVISLLYVSHLYDYFKIIVTVLLFLLTL